MKISAEVVGGVVQTKIPCIEYDQSAKDYDAELMMLGSTLAAACAETVGDGNNDLALTALDAIYDCAKMCLTNGVRIHVRKDVPEE